MFLAPKRKRRPRCCTGAAASPSLLLVLAAGAEVEGCSAVGAGAAGVAWAASPARAQGGEAGSVGGANERRRRRRGATGPSLRAIAQTQTGRACQPTETHCVPAGGPSERGALLQQGRGAAAPLAGSPTAPRGCAAACRSSGGRASGWAPRCAATLLAASARSCVCRKEEMVACVRGRFRFNFGGDGAAPAWRAAAEAAVRRAAKHCAPFAVHRCWYVGHALLA